MSENFSHIFNLLINENFLYIWFEFFQLITLMGSDFEAWIDISIRAAARWQMWFFLVTLIIYEVDPL